MNIRKIAVKSKCLRNRHIKEERTGLEIIISRTESEGNKQVDTYIYYPENIEYLKTKGFKVTQVESVFTTHKYNINWESLI